MNDPEEGSVVPGVNVSVHVESIHNIKVVTVSSEPHEKEGHGSEDGQNQVDEASSGLPTQSNVPRVVNVESVGEHNVERGGTEHHGKDSKTMRGISLALSQDSMTPLQSRSTLLLQVVVAPRSVWKLLIARLYIFKLN